MNEKIDKKELCVSANALDKLTVQKSRSFFYLYHSNFTLYEYKILDLYLSRINSHEPNNRLVSFTKKELENILGLRKIKIEALKKRLKNLMTTVIEIPDEDEKEGFRLLTLFEEAVAKKESGSWTIKLTCTKPAKKYIFNIENLGYINYKLKNIIHLSSLYAYYMYIYIEENRYRGHWKIDIENLKERLGCQKEETYTSYKFFNNSILKKVKSELDEKTNCHYDYASITYGRKVIAIEFKIQKNYLKSNVEPFIIPEIPTEIPDPFDPEREYNPEALWETTIKSFNFKEEEIEELKEILDTIPYSKMPQDPFCPDAPEIQKYLYMEQKSKLVNRLATEKEIRSKYKYLLSILRNDAKCN